MLEYVFFHQVPFDLFTEFLRDQGIRPEVLPRVVFLRIMRS
jgi:hypothetical protein